MIKSENHFKRIKKQSKSNREADVWVHHASSLCLLLLDVGAPQGGAGAAPHLRVQQSAGEHHGRAQPVPGGEGVLEVKDGEDEAEELAERHHQRDGQRGALRGQDENPTDAHVPEGEVKVCNEALRGRFHALTLVLIQMGHDRLKR